MSINHYIDSNIIPKLDIYAKNIIANEFDVENFKCDNLNISNNLEFNTATSKPFGTGIISSSGADIVDLYTIKSDSNTAECETYITDGITNIPYITVEEGVYNYNYNRILDPSTLIVTPGNLLVSAENQSGWNLKISSIAGQDMQPTKLNIKGNVVLKSQVAVPAAFSIFTFELGNTGLEGLNILSPSNTIISAKGFCQSEFPVSKQYELDVVNSPSQAQTTIGNSKINFSYGLTIANALYWVSDRNLYFNFELDILLT